MEVTKTQYWSLVISLLTTRSIIEDIILTKLELVKAVIPRKPFHEEKISRGQQRGLKKGFLSGIFGDNENTDSTGQISNIKEVGYFKGLIKSIQQK
jgi:hypothetical protein